jgi:hypothetical protein
MLDHGVVGLLHRGRQHPDVVAGSGRAFPLASNDRLLEGPLPPEVNMIVFKKN